jgi:peptide/nickel transport system substrate-binding protein
MNEQLPPFDNKLVRQAISYAIPYETIVNEVLNGYGRQLTSPIPDGTPTHTDEFFVYKQDPEKAKELLTEAGFPDGFETTLAVASGNQEGKETAVWVQQSLAEIGITVNIQELPGAAFAEQLQKHELGFFFFNNWISINNDPFYHLYWLFWSPCCNYTNYSNSDVHQLIEEYTLSTDQEARDQASLDAQQAIVDDAPWVFLYQPDFLLAMRSNMKGYVFYSTDRFTRYKSLYKE